MPQNKDNEALAKEAYLIEETDNSPKSEDGPQPPQDKEPDLQPEED